MTEHWERSAVIGTKRGDDEYQVAQVILHRRGEDPLVMACRRDNRMAGADRFSVSTEEAFTEIRHCLPFRMRKANIPRDTSSELWDW